MDTRDVKFGASQLRLKRFNIKDMVEHATIAMIAKRASGKSYLTREILYHKRDLPSAVVISRTEKLNKFYGEFIPDSYIFDNFDSAIPLEITNEVKEKRQTKMSRGVQRQIHKRRSNNEHRTSSANTLKIWYIKFSKSLNIFSIIN